MFDKADFYFENATARVAGQAAVKYGQTAEDYDTGNRYVRVVTGDWLPINIRGATPVTEPVTSEFIQMLNFTGVKQTRQNANLQKVGVTYTLMTVTVGVIGLILPVVGANAGDIPENGLVGIYLGALQIAEADDNLGTGGNFPNSASGDPLGALWFPVGTLNEKVWAPDGLFKTGNLRVDVRSPWEPSAGSLVVNLKFS